MTNQHPQKLSQFKDQFQESISVTQDGIVICVNDMHSQKSMITNISYRRLNCYLFYKNKKHNDLIKLHSVIQMMIEEQ